MPFTINSLIQIRHNVIKENTYFHPHDYRIYNTTGGSHAALNINMLCNIQH